MVRKAHNLGWHAGCFAPKRSVTLDLAISAYSDLFLEGAAGSAEGVPCVDGEVDGERFSLVVGLVSSWSPSMQGFLK